MKNLRKFLVSLGLVLLTNNATAIMINGTIGSDYMEMDLSMQNIAGLLDDYQAETRKESKYLKKANKRFDKLSRFQSKMASSDMGEQKAARKWSRKERRLASVLDKMDLDLTAFMVAAVEPVSQDNTPPVMTGGEESDGQSQSDSDYEDDHSDSGNVVDVKSVPEPSTLALLGIGLVGFAAARRLKRRT